MIDIDASVPKSSKVTYPAVVKERYFLDSDGFDVFFEIKEEPLEKKRGPSASAGKNRNIGAHKFVSSLWP